MCIHVARLSFRLSLLDGVQACKVMGLRQDDLVATSDVITGKNITATCHALWSLAAACNEKSMKVTINCHYSSVDMYKISFC